VSLSGEERREAVRLREVNPGMSLRDAVAQAKRNVSGESVTPAEVQRAARAGQRLAEHWGHEPWSDSWAELVARALLEAARGA
jgi:hypothetical protein